MRTLTALLILGALTATARAEPSDARAVVAGMKSALEPTRPSIRKLTMRVSGGESGETSEVVLGQARTERRTLSVVLAPESLRGTAFLVQNDGAASDVQWLYIPAIGRVRRLGASAAVRAPLAAKLALACLVAFVVLLVQAFRTAWRGWIIPGVDWRPFQLGVLLALVSIVVHGLVDVPYFKNDLSFEFWVLLAISWAGTLKSRPLLRNA